jgi:hypothetical protein
VYRFAERSRPFPPRNLPQSTPDTPNNRQNLERLVPDALENFFDRLLPDTWEAKMDSAAKVAGGAFVFFGSVVFCVSSGRVCAFIRRAATSSTQTHYHRQPTKPTNPTNHNATAKFQAMATDFNEGFGEIAAVLFRVAKYAATRFNIGGAALFYRKDFEDGRGVGGGG